jgi:hypothetical protein
MPQRLQALEGVGVMIVGCEPTNSGWRRRRRKFVALLSSTYVRVRLEEPRMSVHALERSRNEEDDGDMQVTLVGTLGR